jgi:lysophospholipase L1-like esterase
MMKNILAFGDSLTWGFVAGKFERHPFEMRWPSCSRRASAARHASSRKATTAAPRCSTIGTTLTTATGSKALPMLLATHQPLDLVIIMLGTNDIKFANRCRAFDAAMGMGRLIEIVKTFGYLPSYKPPQILIMSPPPLVPTTDEFFNNLWDHAIAGIETLRAALRYWRSRRAWHFFDTGTVAKADPTDGGHLDAENTRNIGTALVPVVKGMLGI